MLFGQLQVDSNALLKEEADKPEVVVKDVNDQPLVDTMPRLENINRLPTIARLTKIKVNILRVFGKKSLFLGRRKKSTWRVTAERQQESRPQNEFLGRWTVQLFHARKGRKSKLICLFGDLKHPWCVRF